MSSFPFPDDRAGVVRRFDLPVGVDTPAKARVRMYYLLRDWGTFEDRYNALLMTSELVTNAVVHAPRGVRSRVRVLVRRRRDTLHVRVANRGSHPSIRARRPADDDEHGRGLLLVDKLASEWGMAGGGPGETIVFFTLRAHAQATEVEADLSPAAECAAVA